MKKSIIIFPLIIFISLLLSGCNSKQTLPNIIEEKPASKGGGEEMEIKNQKKVLMVIAPADFQEKEYQTPRTILENSGYNIVVASKGVTSARGTSGTLINVDKQLNEVKIGDFEAVVFVGGPGTSVYFNDQTALALAQEAYQNEKIIGAICIAPSILANAGILRDKKATVFSSEVGNLKAKGAIYTDQPVTVDGKIITANGPAAAEEFGKEIVELLERS